MAGYAWQFVKFFVLDQFRQKADIVSAVRGNDAELSKMTPDRVDELCPLTDQHFPNPMKDEDFLLHFFLNQYEGHCRSRDSLTDRFRISRIALVRLDVGTDILCREKTNVMTNVTEQSGPKM